MSLMFPEFLKRGVCLTRGSGEIYFSSAADSTMDTNYDAATVYVAWITV